MSEEKMKMEQEERVVIKKKKKRIVTIIITAIVLLAVVIAVICIAKYRAENRYISFAELSTDQILFVEAYSDGYGMVERVWAYDAGGRKYEYVSATDEYFKLEEYYDEIANGQVIENYVAVETVEEMYEKLLQVNRIAKYGYGDVDGGVVILRQDFSMTRCYGVRFLQNGEVEYILIGADKGGVLDDPYAIEIYDWM